MFAELVKTHDSAIEEGLTARLTNPEKPFTLLTVTRDCFTAPTGIERLVAPSDITKTSKHGELTVTVTFVL